MASSSTRLCRAVCLCVVSFASGFLVARLASLRPLKKSAVQKKIIPSSTITPPPSSITLPKNNHVFLSFRGPDTRVGFTSHLYDALSRTCMVTFIDYKLARGDEISPALLKSIQESMIAVVIFSKDYASSKWCLRELVEIIKCKKLHELIVMPVFYYVDPSDVRKQTGPFKDSFAKHENDSPEEVLEWREAFTEAANLSGWDYAATRSESELVRDIVEDVKRKLMGEIENISPPLNDIEGCLIGIDKRIEQVMKLSRPDTKDVIGIWGMGGIGKTTLAESVFHRISSQFDGSCFIEVGERLENRESNCLRLEVLSKVLNEVNLELATPTILHPFIKQRLTQKKVLIVFDDVNKFRRPLETLVNDLIRCGLGSKIIITSRDKHVLYKYNVLDCNIYEVEGLNSDEALELFCKYAFKKKHPTKGFMDLSVRMVCYANGNPLGLRVLGSHLLGKDKQEWGSVFDDLQGVGDSEFFNILKISYDGLTDKEKNLFLDIACFFNGCFEDTIEKLLDCKGPLRSLINKSLIRIERGGIKMHDLLQEMGREIVISECPKNPGKRSRLWKPDDVIWTLENNKGTEAVQGISLDIYDQGDVQLNLSCQVFDKMPNLRLLSFTCHCQSKPSKVHLPDCLNSLPDDLIIFRWYGYPLRVLPSNFSPEKLVKLDLSCSNIEQLWEETKHAPKLKELTLCYCERLTRIPSLPDFLSLEHLDLSGCKSLVEFPSSVQQFNKLRYLSLDGCSNVTKFPLTSASTERLNLSGTAIEEVPSSILSLTNLTELDLSRCTRLKHIPTCILKLKSLLTLCLRDCSQLETFPEISEAMEILNSPELSGTAITEPHSSIEHLNGLPSSICDLTSLENLNLSNCSKLGKLPDNLGNLKSLKKLEVRGTAVGQLPYSIRYLENLACLNCSECRGLTILPPLSGLRSLSKLYLNKCNLMEIPEDIGCLSSLERLEMCENMFESLPKSIKHLSKLETLFLNNCNMLRSLTELPVALQTLEAFNCKQLCQAIPDASEFVRCISKYHKAVDNDFEEYHMDSEDFSICFPGTEIPEWFTFQSSGSSVYIQVLHQDLVNRKLMGFAICVVIGIEECHKEHRFPSVRVNCHFETCDAKISFPLFNYSRLLDDVFINSDHILLGYSSISNFLSYEDIKMLIANVDGDYVDISLEFKVKFFRGYEVKYSFQENEVNCCAVCPIYAESKGGHKGGLPRVIAGAALVENKKKGWTMYL